MLTFVALMNPACRAALASARGSAAGVEAAYKQWPVLQSAAATHGGDPSLLAAIGVRETSFRNIAELTVGGMGRGYFQIDIGKNPAVNEQQAYDANFAPRMLTTNAIYLQAVYPNLTCPQVFQATAASYNAGTGNITGNPATIDQGATVIIMVAMSKLSCELASTEGKWRLY